MPAPGEKQTFEPKAAPAPVARPAASEQQMTYEQSSEISALMDSLLRFQTTVGTIGYDKKVEVGKYGYSYTSFTAILSYVRPRLTEVGLAVMQFLEPNGLRTMLVHKSGEYMACTMSLKPLVKTAGAQAFGGAVTYAKRYALSAMLGLATDEDDDANSVDSKNAKVTNK